MNNALHRILSKINITAKDKAEFINALGGNNGGGGSGNLEQRVSNIEKVLTEILEDFKTV